MPRAATAVARPAARPRRAAAPAPARRAPSRAAPRRRPAARTRPRLAGGVLWIGIVAGLLAGIVALNVAVLRMNMEAQRLDAKKEQLAEGNAALASELSSAAAAGRIEAVASRKLGLVQPAETTYIHLTPRRR